MSGFNGWGKPMQGLGDFVDLRRGERIANIFTVPSGLDEILGSQPGPLLRDRCLSAPNQLSKLGPVFCLRPEETE